MGSRLARWYSGRYTGGCRTMKRVERGCGSEGDQDRLRKFSNLRQLVCRTGLWMACIQIIEYGSPSEVEWVALWSDPRVGRPLDGEGGRASLTWARGRGSPRSRPEAIIVGGNLELFDTLRALKRACDGTWSCGGICIEENEDRRYARLSGLSIAPRSVRKSNEYWSRSGNAEDKAFIRTRIQFWERRGVGNEPTRRRDSESNFFYGALMLRKFWTAFPFGWLFPLTLSVGIGCRFERITNLIYLLKEVLALITMWMFMQYKIVAAILCKRSELRICVTNKYKKCDRVEVYLFFTHFLHIVKDFLHIFVTFAERTAVY